MIDWQSQQMNWFSFALLDRERGKGHLIILFLVCQSVIWQLPAVSIFCCQALCGKVQGFGRYPGVFDHVELAEGDSHLFLLCGHIFLWWVGPSLPSIHKMRFLEFLFTYQKDVKKSFCLYFRVWNTNHTLPILTEFIIRQIMTLERWIEFIKEDDKQVHARAGWDK